MRESKTYQRLMEKAARATTLKNTLRVLNRKFLADKVSVLQIELNDAKSDHNSRSTHI